MKLQYDDETCKIAYGDKIIGDWNDEANCDYPEDLTWGRDIGSLTQKMFDAGRNIEREIIIDLLRHTIGTRKAGTMFIGHDAKGYAEMFADWLENKLKKETE